MAGLLALAREMGLERVLGTSHQGSWPCSWCLHFQGVSGVAVRTVEKWAFAEVDVERIETNAWF
jgi:hypothetical protein